MTKNIETLQEQLFFFFNTVEHLIKIKVNGFKFELVCRHLCTLVFKLVYLCPKTSSIE